MTQQAEGELDEVVAGTSPLQQGAEQHEQEDEAGGDAEGDAKNPLGGDPLVVGQRSEAHSAVGQQPRHPGARQTVSEKDDGDDRQRRPQSTASSFEQQRNADTGRHQIGGGEVARSLGQRLIHHEEVGGRAGRDQGEGDIAKGHPISRRGAKRRKYQKCQQQGKGEVNGAGFGVIEHAKAEHEGERRGDPELEQ